MHNRLKQFLSVENITQAQFANTIGIGKANISHVLAGRNKPGYDFIRAIMTGYPHLNINWLLLGVGKMYNMDTRTHQEVVPREAVIPFDDEVVDESLSLFDDSQTDLSHATPVQETAQSDISEAVEIDSSVLNSIKELVDRSQIPVKQRKVSKIIVLFDDGSYQEL
jgi:transcriptional regulator with XRE-family HTH domain